ATTNKFIFDFNIFLFSYLEFLFEIHTANVKKAISDYQSKNKLEEKKALQYKIEIQFYLC
ncbi:MAG TPA: hypothetical protein PLF66_07005, partial [Leptospiraceae bacterium]|nr:hypothetical protein [Leptospiraceae bacterium]HNG98976.1 hypothetical protein [Leptospiraceae bacterium]